MDLQYFISIISKIEKTSLPAETAHQKMSPPERMQQMKDLNLATSNHKTAAVMMLLYPKNNKMHLVLIVRNSYPGVHSSQISFPGGKVETSDINLQHTAIRETFEEIGVHENKIKVVMSFSKIYIPPSNFMVYPFLGYSVENLDFIPNPSEVVKIIELPIVDLIDENNIVLKQMETSYSKSIAVPAFQFQDHIIWGATAMIMNELKEVLKSVL